MEASASPNATLCDFDATAGSPRPRCFGRDNRGRGPRRPAEAAPAEHLTALAPPLEAAGRLATLASQRSPARAPVVFPVRGRVDWGEQDARFGTWRGATSTRGRTCSPRRAPLFAIRDARVVETGDDGGRGNYVGDVEPAVRRTFVYLHMKHPSRVGVGKPVRAGQRVGAVGLHRPVKGAITSTRGARRQGHHREAARSAAAARRLAARRARPE